ncbi:MAG: Ig-like domain-containing protein, partial [Propionibacteriaceae bacterium]|nr:Ig-like domain-containing protein [Propionibacteriaceae bacterium]
MTATVKGAGGQDVTRSADVKFVTGSIGSVALALSESSHVASDAQGAAVTAAVTVQDQAGFGIPNLTADDVEFSSVPSGVSVKPGSFAATATAGVYTALVYAQTAKVYELTADVNGLSDSQPIEFTAGPPNSALTTWAISPKAPAVPGQATGTLTVLDQFGNAVKGLTAADIVLTPAPSDLTVGAMATAGDGVYSYVLSSAVAQHYDVTAEVGAIVKTDDVTFGAGDVDPAKSKVTVSPAEQKAGQNITATVTVRDAEDNAVKNLTAADFAVTADPVDPDAGLSQLAGSGFVDTGNGVYTFQLTSKAAGEFAVKATVKGTALNDQPGIVFTAAGVCVANCETADPSKRTRAEMTVNDQPNDGKAEDKAVVYAFDTYGNPVPGAQVTAVRSDEQLEPEIQTASAGAKGTAAVGQAEIAWTSTFIGGFTAAVTVDGLTGFPGSTLSDIRFATTGVSAVNSELVVTPPAGEAAPIEAGHAYTATVTVRDAQNQPLPEVAVSFTVASGATLSASKCTTEEDGTCFVTVTSRLVGEYDLEALAPVNGTMASVGAAKVAFKAGPVCFTGCAPVDPSHVTGVKVTLDGQPADGSSADEAVVSSYDVNGNPVDAAWTTAPGGDLTAAAVNGMTGPTGQAVLSYTSTVSGERTATVTVAGKPAPGSPISLHFSAGKADRVALAVDPTTAQTVGLPFTLKAHASDLGGAAVEGVRVDFTAPAAVAFDGEAFCLTDAQGDCSAVVTSRAAGSHVISGAFGGAATAPASVAVEFVAGPVCGAECTPEPGVAADHRTRVEIIKNGADFNGQDPDVVQVFAFDKDGNAVKEAVVASTTSDAALAVQPDIAVTGADGRSTISYTSTAAGEHVAEVTVDGKAPAGSPVTLAFGGGLGDPGKSSFTVTPKTAASAPLTVGSDADSTYVVKATVRDFLGQTVEGESVTFSVKPAGPAWAGGKYSCQTAADGACQVEISSAVAGPYALAANLPKGAIGAAQNVVWTAGEVCGQGCAPGPDVDEAHRTRAVVEVDNQTADGQHPDRVRVYAFDWLGNPVANALVASAPAAGSEGLQVQSGVAGTDDSGQSVIEYRSTAAGSFAADVLVGGETPTGSPVTLTFQAGQVCLAPECAPDPSVPNDRRTRVEVVVNNQLADGHAQDQVKVFAFDRLGNPVADVDTAATTPTGSPVTLVTPTPATDAKGEALLGFVASSAVEDVDAHLYVYVETQSGLREVIFTPQPGSAPPAAMQSSPVSLSFTAGDLDPGRSAFAVDPKTRTVGETTTAAFVAADAQGSPVKGLAAVNLVLDPKGLTVVSGPVEGPDGTYVWTLTTTTANSYEVALAAGGFTKADTVVYNPGAVDPSRSQLTVDPASQTVGQTVTATIVAEDVYGNPVTTLSAADVAVAAAPTSANPSLPGLAAGSFANLADGRYTMALTSQLAGDFTAEAKVQGVALDDRPAVAFTAGGVCVSGCQPVDPSHVTRAELVVNDQPNDGKAEDVARVWAYDTYGNISVGAKVVASRQDAELEPASQEALTGPDGTATVAWTSTGFGPFTADITVDGLSGFDGSVLTDISFVTTGVDAGNSRLTVTAPAGQTAPVAVGQSYTAEVTVRDAQGGLLKDVPVSFGATPAAGAPAGAAAQLSLNRCVTNAAGVCSVEVTARVAADYTLRATVSVNGQAVDVDGSPAAIGFKAGPVCFEGCDPVDPTHLTRVVVTRNGQKADGVAADQATVYAYDGAGNPVQALWTTSTTDAQLSIVEASGVTGADGAGVIEYTSEYSGGHQAAVTIAGQVAKESPITLSFAAGDVASAWLTSSPAGPLTVGEAYTVTAHANDLGGQPVSGVEVSFSAPGAVTLSRGDVAFPNGQGSCATGADGTCALRANSTTAGDFEVSAAVGGQPLDDSPAALAWNAGEVCVAGCTPADPSHVTRVEVIRNGANFDGVDRDIAQVWAYDKWGNPKAGQAVQATPRGSDLTAQSDVLATNAEGVTTIWFTSTAAGQHLADVTVAGLTPETGSPATLAFGA